MLTDKLLWLSHSFGLVKLCALLRAVWMRELSLFCSQIFTFPLCPGENLKHCLVEVFGLVSENIMTSSSDHLTNTSKQKHRVTQESQLEVRLLQFIRQHLCMDLSHKYLVSKCCSVSKCVCKLSVFIQFENEASTLFLRDSHQKNQKCCTYFSFYPYCCLPVYIVLLWAVKIWS